MLTSVFHEGAFALRSVLAAFAAAFVLGLLIAAIFRCCTVSRDFPVVLAVTPMLVAAVIMIVNGNLGASVAVLGAFGLVRFRSAPGTAVEIGFLFFAMAAGLAVGMGFLTLAFLLTVLVGTVFLVLEKTGFGNSESKERQLKITIPENLDYNGIFDDLFQKYAAHAALQRVRTTNMGTMYELTYLLRLKDMAQQKEFMDELRCRNGNLTVMLGLVKRARNEL